MVYIFPANASLSGDGCLRPSFTKPVSACMVASKFITGLGIFYRDFPKAKVRPIDCAEFTAFSNSFCCLQIRSVLIFEVNSAQRDCQRVGGIIGGWAKEGR